MAYKSRTRGFEERGGGGGNGAEMEQPPHCNQFRCSDSLCHLVAFICGSAYKMILMAG